MRSEPRSARTPVWPLSISLAATLEIDFSFSSSGYLDVSVHRVPFHTLWIGVWIHEVFSCGFPHSDICGSRNICFSPQLFAAYHVFLRLLVPRHPPCALFCLTSFASVSIALETGSLRFSTLYQLLTLIFGLLQTNVCFSDVLIKIFLSISVWSFQGTNRLSHIGAPNFRSYFVTSVDNPLKAIAFCQFTLFV